MRYIFGDFVLDEGLFELKKKDTRVPLRRQAIDVLLHLIRARGRVVAKAELLTAIWGGAHVSETALPQAITAIRRALEDDAIEPTIVETVRTRGYRFALEAREAAAPAPDTRSAFVGRSEVIARLSRLIGDARTGRGGVALVVGSPGAGKTRALAEMTAAARAEGARIVAARCEERGAPDLWPWIQILRACATDESRGAIDAALQEVEGEATERFRFFDVATQTLVAAARDEPVVVVIDDLHWADASSLLLFKLAAQTLAGARVVLVATYRDTAVSTNHVLARTLGALTREDPTRSIHLEPFGREEIASLARAILGREPESEILERIVAKTEGNALFVTQMLHVIRSEAWMTPGAEGATSALLEPEEVREALSLHLDELSAECRRVLSAAAVIGATFSIAALAPIADLAPVDALTALDEAIRAKVVAPVDGRAPAFRFVHLLVRDLLYKKLGRADRHRLHEAAARAFGDLGQRDESDVHAAKAKVLLA